MHIAEGFLPWPHAVGWTVAAAPWWVVGARKLKDALKDHPWKRLELGSAGGFTFLVSALKIPSVAGSSSHPTGIALGATRLGPWEMGLVGTVVLFFQALLLAHGGFTTLGANAFAMAVVGGWTAWWVHRAVGWCGLPRCWGLFLAAFFSDLATYATTSFQLALAFPDPRSGVWGSMLKFLGIFGFTQVPLAVAEGFLTVFVAGVMHHRSRNLQGEIA